MKSSKRIIAFFVILALHCATSMNSPPGPPPHSSVPPLYPPPPGPPPHSSVPPFYPPPPGPPPHNSVPPFYPPPPGPPPHSGTNTDGDSVPPPIYPPPPGPPPHDGTRTDGDGVPPPPIGDSVPPSHSLEGLADLAKDKDKDKDQKTKKKKNSVKSPLESCIHFVDGTKMDPESLSPTTIATTIEVLKTVVSLPSTIQRAIVCDIAIQFLLVRKVPVIIDLEDGNLLVVFPDNTSTCVSALVLKSLKVDEPLFVPIFRNLPEFHMRNGESQKDYNVFFKATTWSLTMDQPPKPVIPKEYPNSPSLDMDALLGVGKTIDTMLSKLEPQDQMDAESPMKIRAELQLPLQHLVPKMQIMKATTMVIALDVSGSMFELNRSMSGKHLTMFVPVIKRWIDNIIATGIFNPVFPTMGANNSGDLPIIAAILHVTEKVVIFMNMKSPHTRLIVFPFSHTSASPDFVILTTTADAKAFLSTLTSWIENISANLGSTKIRVPETIRKLQFERGSHVCIVSDGAIDMVNGSPEQTSVEHFNALVKNGGVGLEVSCVIVCGNATEMTTDSQQFGVLRQLFENKPGDEPMSLTTLKYGNASLKRSDIVAVDPGEIDGKANTRTVFRDIVSVDIHGKSVQLVTGLESMVLAGNLTGSSLGMVLPALCNHIVQESRNESIVSRVVTKIFQNLNEKDLKWIEKNLNKLPVRFYTSSQEEQEEIIAALINQKKQSQDPANVEDPKKAKSECEVPPQTFMCFGDLLRQRNKGQSPLKIESVDTLTFESREGMIQTTVRQPKFDVQMTLMLQKLHCIQDGASMSINVNVQTRKTKWRIGFAPIELELGETYSEPEFAQTVKLMGDNLKVVGDNMMDVLKKNPQCIIAVSNHITAHRSMKEGLVVPEHLPNNDIIVNFSRSSPDHVTVNIVRNGSITATHTLLVTKKTFLCISAVMPASVVTITGNTLQKIDPAKPLFMCKLPDQVTKKPEVQRKYVMPISQKQQKCQVLTTIPMKAPEVIEHFRIVVNENGFSIISINPRSPVSGMRALSVVELLRYGITDPTVCNNLLLEILKRCLMFSDPRMIEFLSTSATLSNSMARFISLRCEIPIEDAVAYVETICGKALHKVFDISSVHEQVMTIFPSTTTCLDLKSFKQVVSDGETLAELSWLDANLHQIGTMSIWTNLLRKMSFAPENVKQDMSTIILATSSVAGIGKLRKCVSLLLKISMRMVAFGSGKRFSFGTTSTPNEFRLWLIKLDRFMKTNFVNGDGVLKHILDLHRSMNEALKRHASEERAVIERITNLMVTAQIPIVSHGELDPNIVHAVGLNWGNVTEDGVLGPYQASDIRNSLPQLNSTPSGRMLVSPSGLFGNTTSLTAFGIMSEKELCYTMKTQNLDLISRPLVSWVDIGLHGQRFDAQPPERTYFHIGPVFNPTTYTIVTDTMVAIINLMHVDDKALARWRSLVLMRVMNQIGVFAENSPSLDLASIIWHVMLKLPPVEEKDFDYSGLAESTKFACNICANDLDMSNTQNCVTFPVTPCSVFCGECVTGWAQQTRDMSFDECVATGTMIPNPMTGLQESATEVFEHCRARNTPGTPEYTTFQEYLELLKVSQALIARK